MCKVLEIFPHSSMIFLNPGEVLLLQILPFEADTLHDIVFDLWSGVLLCGSSSSELPKDELVVSCLLLVVIKAVGVAKLALPRKVGVTTVNWVI